MFDHIKKRSEELRKSISSSYNNRDTSGNTGLLNHDTFTKVWGDNFITQYNKERFEKAVQTSTELSDEEKESKLSEVNSLIRKSIQLPNGSITNVFVEKDYNIVEKSFIEDNEVPDEVVKSVYEDSDFLLVESEYLENVEKGVYADNAKNRKLGRVGQKFGGESEDSKKKDESDSSVDPKQFEKKLQKEVDSMSGDKAAKLLDKLKGQKEKYGKLDKDSEKLKTMLDKKVGVKSDDKKTA